MVCKLYDDGNCIGRKMFINGALSMSAAFTLGERALELKDDIINMYCFHDGVDRNLTCGFLRWYENNVGDKIDTE